MGPAAGILSFQMTVRHRHAPPCCPSSCPLQRKACTLGGPTMTWCRGFPHGWALVPLPPKQIELSHERICRRLFCEHAISTWNPSGRAAFYSRNRSAQSSEDARLRKSNAFVCPQQLRVSNPSQMLVFYNIGMRNPPELQMQLQEAVPTTAFSSSRTPQTPLWVKLIRT